MDVTPERVRGSRRRVRARRVRARRGRGDRALHRRARRRGRRGRAAARGRGRLGAVGASQPAGGAARAAARTRPPSASLRSPPDDALQQGDRSLRRVSEHARRARPRTPHLQRPDRARARAHVEAIDRAFVDGRPTTRPSAFIGADEVEAITARELAGRGRASRSRRRVDRFRRARRALVDLDERLPADQRVGGYSPRRRSSSARSRRGRTTTTSRRALGRDATLPERRGHAHHGRARDADAAARARGARLLEYPGRTARIVLDGRGRRRLDDRVRARRVAVARCRRRAAGARWSSSAGGSPTGSRPTTCRVGRR